MELCTHEKAVFFLPVNILTVWCASFLGRTTHAFSQDSMSSSEVRSHKADLINESYISLSQRPGLGGSQDSLFKLNLEQEI